jgi:hypothetical protein
MSKSDVVFEFDKSDVDNLMKVMYAASEKLNIELGSAMKMAVASLVGSLSASTRIAPKYREINERPSFVNEAEKNILRKQSIPFAVTGYFGKPRTYQSKLVWAKNFQNAKEKHAKITRRGLAKLSWRMVGTLMRQNVDQISASGIEDAISKKIAASNVEGRANYEGSEIFAELHNSISYIKEAMVGGPKEIDTVFDRAVANMEGKIQHKLDQYFSGLLT